MSLLLKVLHNGGILFCFYNYCVIFYIVKIPHMGNHVYISIINKCMYSALCLQLCFVIGVRRPPLPMLNRSTGADSVNVPKSTYREISVSF